MEKKYIENSKERLLRIKAILKEEKAYRSANGFAAASSIAMLPFAIINSFSYGSTSGFFVTSFVIMCASSNSIYFFKSQKKISQAIMDYKNLKNEYNSQKKLTNKANH